MIKAAKSILLILWLALAAWGLIGIYQRFNGGRELASYGSYVPWGLWISVYIYFVGMSAGMFLLSTLAYVFNVKTYKPLGRVCLFGAMVTLMMGLLCIWLDLGHMGRIHEIFTRPNFSSLMTWLAWLYGLYFVLLAIMMRFALQPRAIQDEDPGRGTLRALGAITLPIVVIISGGVGALFATLAGRPYWHSGLFPILFLIGAVVCAMGLLIFTVSVFEYVPERERTNTLKQLSLLQVGLIGFYLLIEFAEFSIPMWYGIGAENQIAREVLFGGYWWVFWIVHLLLGSAIPLILLASKPTSRPATALAGGLVLITFLAVRLNVVIPGQVTPALEGLRNAYVDNRLSFEYLPAAFEWSIVAFVVAIGIAVFHLGRKVLPLIVVETQLSD
ncbi:MAG: NrfD/PsrC family molybdoenzyme membrane anchor subunit [Planctomycetota bacterium]|jgi:molybdopterin-containing oxidoreductase family membrane subunit